MKHGLLFGEHIKTEKIKKRSYDDVYTSHFRSHSMILLIILFIGVSFLCFRLVFLQLVQGNKYRLLADSNRIRSQVIPAPRGIIFDRNGVPLVFNTPGFRQVIKKGDTVKSVHLEKQDALQKIAKGDASITVDSLRTYPYAEATSHVLGYLGQITKEELDEQKDSLYEPTDWVGKSGIESFYESILRGKNGKQLIEVDALGNIIRSLGEVAPRPGKDITLTLDSNLQQAVFEATKDVEKGAIVVSTPKGEILAMVSRPSFDANLFTLDKTYKIASTSSYPSIQKILTDSNGQPLLNRAISGVYPPGSTFKLVTSVSGLEKKIIDKNYTVTDTGVLKVGEFSYGNWYFIEQGKKEEGPVDLTRALARSNDIFFYKLAEKIGVKNLSETAGKFGVGNLSNIDLPGESEGLLPTKDWKKKHIKEDWFVGDTFQYGIGQGYLLATPLQVNMWTEVLANGGTLYQQQMLKQDTPTVLSKNLVSEKNRDLIREGMIDSCTKGGVAFPLFDFRVKNSSLKIDNKNFVAVSASGSAKMVEIPIACKTGTAQHGGEHTLPHAWITLFAPAYNPQVVITVLVEAKGQGSSEAGPIAKKILQAYFEKPE